MKERQHKMKFQIKKSPFILPMFLMLTSCSNSMLGDSKKLSSIPGEQGSPMLFNAEAKWFSHSDRFKIEHTGAGELTHMFYDPMPNFNSLDMTVSFVVETPRESEIRYGLDIVSGQHYVEDSYCHQEDVWEQFNDIIYKPSFNIGIIPRTIDELGKAQRIFVFGGDQKIQSYFKEKAFDARVIGALVEKNCFEGICFKKSQWKKNLILVGVYKGDDLYDDVKNLKDLKKLVNWPSVIAFIENAQGKNKVGDKYYPAFKVEAEMNGAYALDYMSKNAMILKTNKLSSIRNSCFKLYDEIWNEVAKDSDFEKKMRQLKTDTERAILIKQTKLKDKTLFYKRFKKMFQKNSRHLKTCFNYVYPSNINDSPQRHWFFARYWALHLLHDLGHNFDCVRGEWSKNGYVAREKEKRKSKGFKRCSAKAIDLAFQKAPDVLDMLRGKKSRSYRYVSYDNKSYGTHNKLYSWVPYWGKVFDCKKKPEVEIRKRARAMRSFPRDIKWNNKRLGVLPDGSKVR